MSFWIAGSGKSMARLLYAALTACFCFSMVYLAVRHAAFDAAEAAGLATLAGGLSAAWVAGKLNRTPGGQA